MKITQSAIDEVKKVMSEMDLETEENFLRIEVAGGGCSGMSYSMSFAEKLATNPLEDIFSEHDGIKTVVQRRFDAVLADTTIDFVDSNGRTGFVFQNAKSSAAGGCGSGCGGGGGCSR